MSIMKVYESRINVPCSRQVREYIEEVSEREGIPMAAVARQLLRKGIEVDRATRPVEPELNW